MGVGSPSGEWQCVYGARLKWKKDQSGNRAVGSAGVGAGQGVGNASVGAASESAERRRGALSFQQEARRRWRGGGAERELVKRWS